MKNTYPSRWLKTGRIQDSMRKDGLYFGTEMAQLQCSINNWRLSSLTYFVRQYDSVNTCKIDTWFCRGSANEEIWTCRPLCPITTINDRRCVKRKVSNGRRAGGEEVESRGLATNHQPRGFPVVFSQLMAKRAAGTTAVWEFELDSRSKLCQGNLKREVWILRSCDNEAQWENSIFIFAATQD